MCPILPTTEEATLICHDCVAPLMFFDRFSVYWSLIVTVPSQKLYKTNWTRWCSSGATFRPYRRSERPSCWMLWTWQTSSGVTTALSSSPSKTAKTCWESWRNPVSIPPSSNSSRSLWRWDGRFRWTNRNVRKGLSFKKMFFCTFRDLKRRLMGCRKSSTPFRIRAQSSWLLVVNPINLW